MKKILAMLLCLSMLFCITPIIASAEGETDTGIMADGGITSLEGLRNLANKNGNYYLANDLYVDLSSATLPLIPDTFTGNLDGRGKSILFKDKDTGALTNVNNANKKGIVFDVCRASSVKNLTVGSPDAIPTLVSNQANCGIFAQNTNAATLFENITVYGNLVGSRTNAMNRGLILAKSGNQVKFVNCKVIGNIDIAQTHTYNVKIGGIIGTYASTSKNQTVLMSGCISEVTMTQSGGGNGFSATWGGGLIGLYDTPLTIKDEATNNYEATNNELVIINCITKNTPALKSTAGNPIPQNSGSFYGNTSGATVNVINCAALDVDASLETALDLTTAAEASVRFNAPTGIRFYNTVSGLYDTLVSYYGVENVKMGTVIAPKAIIETAGAFTKEALGALNSTSATYLDVEYANEWFSAPESEAFGSYKISANTEYEYVGSIANILPENYTLEFCGIGYISYNDGTGWKTVYATYGEAAGIPAFSVRALAQAVYADPNATAAEKAAVEKYLAE